jgi:type IV secretory pathway TraG/TraD family ATPase VirD4
MEGNAARRALGILGRARSAGGQAIVVTQSAADVPSATGNEALRESLADNFSAFVVHRQTSAQSREWVSRLMGTREIWASTDRTVGGGRAEGTGSRRRVREYRVRPDSLQELAVGQAYVWVPDAGYPEKVDVAIPEPLPGDRAASSEPAYSDAGPRELPETEAKPTASAESEQTEVGSAASADPNVTSIEAAPSAVERRAELDGDVIERPRRVGRSDDERL